MGQHRALKLSFVDRSEQVHSPCIAVNRQWKELKDGKLD